MMQSMQNDTQDAPKTALNLTSSCLMPGAFSQSDESCHYALCNIVADVQICECSETDLGFQLVLGAL